MFWALAARAGTPVESVTRGSLAQLGLDTWTHDSGLADNWVRDIVEDADGFLWVATSGGLSRFDGQRFDNFTAVSEPELPANSISALATGPEGRLWIGLDHGGVRRFERGHVRRDTRLDALPPAAVQSLLEAADGTLWIGTAAGLWRFRPAVGLENVAPDAAPRNALINRVVADGDHGVWVRTRNEGLWRVRGDSAREEVDAPQCLGLDLVVARDGRQFTSCVEGIFERRPGDGSWTRTSDARRSQRLLLDRADGLWYGDGEQLARRSAGAVEKFGADAQLGYDRVRAFFEDSRGEVWIGTFARGLSRLRAGPITAFGAPEGLAITGTTAVVSRTDGSLWLGTNDGGAVLWKPRSREVLRWTVADGLPSDRVLAIAQDRRRPERAWFGTDRGLIELDGGVVRAIDRPGVPPGAGVSTLFVDPLADDTLWVSGPSGGAEELRGSQAVRHDAQNGLDLAVVRFFHRNGRGALLAGGEGGLYSFDGERWQEVLPGGRAVRSLRAIREQEDGTIWLAAQDSGLLRWSNGGVTLLGEREGLPFNHIYSLELDDQGGLWMSGVGGLARIRLSDFDRWTRGELDGVPAEQYFARDGLRDGECNGWGSPPSVRLAEGTLVYPTMSGFALADPARLAEPELTASRILVASAWAGERELDPGAPVQLSRVERQLLLRFTALEFVRPESVAFRYRLEGLDRDWQTASRQRAAVYSNVAPGRYRFRLQARLPGAAWIEAARPLSVAVTPRLWEATWFRSIAVAGSLFAVASLFRWRLRVERVLRASQAELRQLASLLIRAQEDERRRLAREIHDDLTQRLAGLGMQAGALARSVGQGRVENVGARVDELGRELERLASDAQTLSRDLHPALIERLGLEAALRSECATFEERTGLRVLLDSRGVPEDLEPEISLELYRIAQEALRNAHAHGRAGEVSVAVECRNGALALAIEDAGVGFDPASVRAHRGLGLASMAERARLIGAVLEIHSAPGRGTRIAVRVELDAASRAVAAAPEVT